MILSSPPSRNTKGPFVSSMNPMRYRGVPGKLPVWGEVGRRGMLALQASTRTAASGLGVCVLAARVEAQWAGPGLV